MSIALGPAGPGRARGTTGKNLKATPYPGPFMSESTKRRPDRSGEDSEPDLITVKQAEAHHNRNTSVYWQAGRRQILWRSLSVLLLLVYFGGIAIAIATNFKLSSVAQLEWRLAIAFGALLLASVPKLYWWREAQHFQCWIANQSQLSQTQRTFEIERFRINSDNAQSFWTGVIVVFTGLLIKVSD
jgi:hypothetical protein